MEIVGNNNLENVKESMDTKIPLEEQPRAARFVMRNNGVQYSINLNLQHHLQALSYSLKHQRIKHMEGNIERYCTKN